MLLICVWRPFCQDRHLWIMYVSWLKCNYAKFLILSPIRFRKIVEFHNISCSYNNISSDKINKFWSFTFHYKLTCLFSMWSVDAVLRLVCFIFLFSSVYLCSSYHFHQFITYRLSLVSVWLTVWDPHSVKCNYHVLLYLKMPLQKKIYQHLKHYIVEVSCRVSFLFWIESLLY